jgi:hypothetical protein
MEYLEHENEQPLFLHIWENRNSILPEVYAVSLSSFRLISRQTYGISTQPRLVSYNNKTQVYTSPVPAKKKDIIMVKIKK